MAQYAVIAIAMGVRLWRPERLASPVFHILQSETPLEEWCYEGMFSGHR
jgi:hypothetical protein